MFSKTFDISENKKVMIECPYCESEHSFTVDSAEYCIINCQRDLSICANPFVLSVQTIATDDKLEANIRCLKIEGCGGPRLLFATRKEPVRNYG